MYVKTGRPVTPMQVEVAYVCGCDHVGIGLMPPAVRSAIATLAASHPTLLPSALPRSAHAMHYRCCMSWGNPGPDRRTPGRTEARATRAWRWAVVQSECA